VSGLFDRDFATYCWYGDLDKKAVIFLTWLKSIIKTYPSDNKSKTDSPNVIRGLKIKLPG
jgi:hypothetical protein